MAYTRGLAGGHYENFHVVSRVLPRRLRDDFSSVYAFCRWADDLGDETGDPAESLRLLEWWQRELEECFAGRPRHPVFAALREAAQRHGLPIKPFADLIDAFKQDQRVVRYETWEEVLDYCTRSANPVGRLVLMMCGYRDEERLALSDQTCSALQLVNFWQDVRRDILERGRVYVPMETARRNGLEVERMVECVMQDKTPNEAMKKAYRPTLVELCDKTEPMFAEGRRLWRMVSRDVRPAMQLFTLGGEAVLKKIRGCDYGTLERRPKLGRWDKMRLMVRVLAAIKLGVG